MPASSRSTSATKAPSRAKATALARPMPEPAPVTTAISSFRRMSQLLPMAHPPRVQVEGGIRAVKARPPAELLCHARDRERRTIGIGVQINVWIFAGAGKSADETRIEIGQMLSPLQRRPLATRRDIVEAMLRFCGLDQHGHSIGNVRRVDPVADSRTSKHRLFFPMQCVDDLHLRAQRIAHAGSAFPRPEHAAQPHTDEIRLPERGQTRCYPLRRVLGDGVKRDRLAWELFVRPGVTKGGRAERRSG